MEYVNVKGAKISKITLGTVQLGLNYGINNSEGQPSVEKAHGILEEAIKGGINVFDTSSAYGTSESVLGSYFKKCKEKPFTVTKFVVGGCENPLSPLEVEKKVRAQVENSILQLGYDKLPLLLVHHETDLDCYGGCLSDILNRLKKENLIDRAGVSLNHFSFVDKVVKDDIYEAVQLPLNLLDVKNATGKQIQTLAKKGLAVFIRSVYLQGLIFKDPENLPQGVLQNAKKPLEKLREIAGEENLSLAGLAVSYIRDLEGVSSLVMGADNANQVKENIDLINVKSISENAREKIVSSFFDIDERVLSPWVWNK